MTLRAKGALLSLWAYHVSPRDGSRPPIVINRDGDREYWLDRTDPLLNTVLPGTAVSIVCNFGDSWAIGGSPMTSEQMPNACVIGPVTRSRILHVGRRVAAIGAVLPPTLGQAAFGVPTAALVDRVIPLDAVWSRQEIDTVFDATDAVTNRQRAAVLFRVIARRVVDGVEPATPTARATALIARSRGQMPIEAIARQESMTRQRLAREFAQNIGMTPKLFARVTRFQTLVHALLSADVAEWAAVAPALGFYDQAHMINEFHEFAGASPTRFFRDGVDGGRGDSSALHGRPHEWRLK